MADFISDLAAKAGIDAGIAEKGVGALLSTLQKHVPQDAYSKVASAIPNASNLLSKFQSSPAPTQGGGLADLASLAGGLLGGKSEAASTLISQFSKAGFSLETAKTFLPVVLELIRNKVSPDTMRQIEGAIPGLGNLLGAADAGGFLGKIKKMFS